MLHQLSLSCSPNPFTGRLTLNYYLPEKQNVSLEIRDLAGRQLCLMDQGSRNTGSHSISTDARELPPGALIAILRAGKEQRSLLIIHKSN
jgi:hypothetical protein